MTIRLRSIHQTVASPTIIYGKTVFGVPLAATQPDFCWRVSHHSSKTPTPTRQFGPCTLPQFNSTYPALRTHWRKYLRSGTPKNARLKSLQFSFTHSLSLPMTSTAPSSLMTSSPSSLTAYRGPFPVLIGEERTSQDSLLTPRKFGAPSSTNRPLATQTTEASVCSHRQS